MILKGIAKLVGVRSGKTKDGKSWCSAVFDAPDDPLERVQYFVPDDLADKLASIGSGDVEVQARIYPMKDAFGSRLVDVNPLPLSVPDIQKGGEKK